MVEDSVGSKPKRVVVRPARKNDAWLLSVLFTKVWREAGPSALGFAGANDEAMVEIASAEFLLKRLTSPNTKIIVAEESRDIIGFASLRRAADGTCDLNGMAVLEVAAKEGVGARLLRKACLTAANLGYRRVEAKVELSNLRALRLYKESGFTEARRTLVKIGRTSTPVQVLEKRLR